MDSGFRSRLANPLTLGAELASLVDPNNYAIGTRVAIKMNFERRRNLWHLGYIQVQAVSKSPRILNWLYINTKVKVGVGLRKKYIGYIYDDNTYNVPSLEFERIARQLPSGNTPLNAGLLYEEQGGALQYYQPYMTELVSQGTITTINPPNTPYIFNSLPSRDEILSFPKDAIIYVQLSPNQNYYRMYKVTDTLVDFNKLI